MHSFANRQKDLLMGGSIYENMASFVFWYAEKCFRTLYVDKNNLSLAKFWHGSVNNNFIVHLL